MGDGWKKEGNISSKNRMRSVFMTSFFLIVVAVCIIFIVLLSRPQVTVKSMACGDGSLYNSCSLNKPYYCINGTLTENATHCGCPDGMKIKGDSCFSFYQTEPKSRMFSYTLNGRSENISYELYGGLSDYLSNLPWTIAYSGGEKPKRSDFALRKLNDASQKNLLESLVKEIENLAPNSKVDQARIAISMVQNIPWGGSNESLRFGSFNLNYSRYPYQVLYDNQGLCGEKSELLAFMLRDMGYGVVLFYYPKENHETVGISCPIPDSLNGTGYCFVETSGPAIISDSDLVYANGERLGSSPEIIFISNGISLPPNLPEYRDARTLSGLVNRWWLDPISSAILRNLEKKYGLGEIYNIN